MSDFSFDTLIDDAKAERTKALKTAIGGPLADLKAFLEGDDDHHTKLEVANKLAALLRDPKSVVALATDSNGHQARALGSGTSDTSAATPVSTDPMTQRFTALDTPAAQAAIQFGERLASGNITPLMLLALSNIVDGTPGWEVADDGSGQPVLKATQTAQTAADAAKRNLRDLAAKIEGPVNDAIKMIPTVRKMQDDVDAALPASYGGSMGPDPAQRNKLEADLGRAQSAIQAAKRF